MAGFAWRCAICLAFLALTLKELMTHVYEVHSTSPNFHVLCGIDQCPSTYRIYHSFYKHVKRHHANFYQEKDITANRQLVGVPPTTISIRSEGDGELTDEGEIPQMDRTVDPPQRIPDRTEDARMNYFQAEDQRQTSASQHVLQMKHMHHLTQGAVSSLMTGTTNLVNQTSRTLKQKIIHRLTELEVDESVINNISDVTLNPIFKDVGNIYLQKKYVQEKHKRVVPREIVLGSSIRERRFGFKRRPISVPDQYYYIPILESLEQFLQNEKIFQLVTSPGQTTDGYLSDIFDGQVFRTHPIFNVDMSLVIILYYDDVEICCPLGTKSRKLCCFYYALGNLPSMYRLKLCNIRLLALVEKPIMNKYGIDTILEPFVADMKILETGYSFNVLDEMINLRGGLYAILGDTPASHLIAGYKEGVGFAYQKCRMCLCTYDKMQTCFTESQFTMRSQMNYLACCEEIERADTEYMRDYLRTQYGINRRSMLTEIPFFNISNSLPQDIMHVVLEGIAHYELKETMKYYINEANIFSLKDFNNQVEHFQFGYHEMRNRPSTIITTTLNSPDNRLKQNASQMNLLLKIILFVLLQLGVDRNEERFHFMVSLIQMFKLLVAPLLSLGSVSNLKDIVKDHLTLFTTCYPNCTIIPKQHYLIHLPTCIKQHGPCSGYSCMRFEGKNKVPKTIARNKNNFINVTKTVAEEMTHIEALDSSLTDTHPSFANELLAGTVSKVEGTKKTYFCEKLNSFYDINTVPDVIYHCTYITYRGTKYIKQRAVLLKGIGPEGVFPEFGTLSAIYIVNMCEIYFELQMLQTEYFDENVQSYCVEEPRMPEATVLCKIDDLLDFRVYSTVLFENSLFVPTLYDLTDLLSSKS